MQKPFSMALELAFLSSKLVRALSKFPEVSDKGRRLFGKGAEFFTQALKGEVAVRTLRVTSSAAEEARTYGWGLRVLALTAPHNNTEEDIQNTFEGFYDDLRCLEKINSNIATIITPERIEALTKFFRCMRDCCQPAKIGEVI